MSSNSEKPLVTFAVLAYNNAPYIKSALDGALSQDYSPMEVVISDDCSTDNTWEIINDVISKYSGNAKVISNRNEKNLGIGAHINRIVDISSGEWIVCAAGDDVSLPNRTDRLMASVTCSAFSIYSNLNLIDERGDNIGVFVTAGNTNALSIGEAVQRKGVYIIGASHAFKREQFRRFGRIDDRVVREDEVISFRSLLLGDVLYIPDCLVNYRIHNGNISVTKRDKSLKLAQQRLLLVNREIGKVESWLQALSYEQRLAVGTRMTQLEDWHKELTRYRDDDLLVRRQFFRKPLIGIIDMFRVLRVHRAIKMLVRCLLEISFAPERHRAMLRLVAKIRNRVRNVGA